MNPPVWEDDWFAAAGDRTLRAWRAVEAQHVVATMRLVDSLDEQAVLEQLLEASKPAPPPATHGLHYLLATPFRYRSPLGSRFRRAGTAGVWYGAATLRTACAEVAYWRWRFLIDSTGLRDGELLTEHTLFTADVAGRALDLTEPPWSAARGTWVHPADYRSTQALAEATRGRQVQWIRYESARDPGGTCAAVLDPRALHGPDLASQQTWHCRTTRHAVRLVHGDDRHEWRFDEDAAAVVRP
jgi:hypothetical protein